MTWTEHTWILASVALEKTLSLPLQETEEVLCSAIRWHTFEETSASEISGLARGAIAKFPLLPPLLLRAVARIAVCVGGLFAGKSVSDPPPLATPCCCCCCCCSAYSRAANNRGHLPWWILLSDERIITCMVTILKWVVWNSTISIMLNGNRYIVSRGKTVEQVLIAWKSIKMKDLKEYSIPSRFMGLCARVNNYPRHIYL